MHKSKKHRTGTPEAQTNTDWHWVPRRLQALLKLQHYQSLRTCGIYAAQHRFRGLTLCLTFPPRKSAGLPAGLSPPIVPTSPGPCPGWWSEIPCSIWQRTQPLHPRDECLHICEVVHKKLTHRAAEFSLIHLLSAIHAQNHFPASEHLWL